MTSLRSYSKHYLHLSTSKFNDRTTGQDQRAAKEKKYKEGSVDDRHQKKKKGPLCSKSPIHSRHANLIILYVIELSSAFRFLSVLSAEKRETASI